MDSVTDRRTLRPRHSTWRYGERQQSAATVRNAGDAGSAATTLRYYRSTDATISGSDTAVGTDAVGALAASGTSAESISLTAPSTAGTYYYGACVDSVTGESDTTNNCSGSVTVTVEAPAQYPDLAVGTPTVSDSSPETGASFTLSATVRNAGDAGSAATTLRYYRSTDATISGSDTAVGTDAVGALAASGTSAESISLTAPSTAGTYYYGACVDSVTGESDTTNNCSGSVTVTVEAPAQYPDLAVGTPTVSDSSPETGASFTLSATVRNAGDAGSAATTLRYYRSTDATISGSDTAVGTDAVGALAASGTSAESISLTAPSTAGTYYYGACVDSVTGESSTANNCSGSVTVTVEAPAQYPDLAVGTPTVSDSSAETGASFTLSATVRNAGDAGSAATTLRYYRSTDATISGSDTAVGTDAVGALAASGSSDESVILNAPSIVGGYYYGACVDSVVDESDTENNCSPSVQVTVRGYPDLVVESPSVSESNPDAGEEFTLSATIRNRGDAGAAATTLRYYRSADATISTADTSVATGPVTGLAASGRSDESVILNAPPTVGGYYYGACVDSVVDESDTENNCSPSVQVTVRGYPDLVVESPSVSESATGAGEEFTLSATIRNRGDAGAAATTLRYYRSADATISTADTSVATDPVTGLAASGSGDESVILNAPSTFGPYYYGACVDGVVDESDTENNCSPSVRVTVRGYPDLVVESPSVSESATGAGEEFTLSATIRNRGDAGAAATTLRYYRSADATISTADTSVATDPVTGLAASGSGDESVVLNAPSTFGSYYYGACVDGVVDESDTQNNCSPSVRVTVRGYPDLVVESPSVSESATGAGEEFTLSATIRNRGDAGAAATTLRYYRSADATISTADTSVATDPVTGLAASGSGDESVVLNAPSTFGSYYYGACVDGVVDESDTENNCSPSVRVTVRGYPDLVVESPSVSESATGVGEEFRLSATIRNRGDAGAAATTLRYYRSADATISTADTSVATGPVTGLAASGSSDASVVLNAPSTVGGYYYGACVDSVVDESDTQNNCSPSVQVTVRGYPDLVVESPSVSESATGVGEEFTLSATIRNRGDAGAAATTLRYYRSADATISTADTSVATGPVTGLAASGSSDESVILNAPPTVGGYYYGACVDSVVDESDTENNCSPSVRVTVRGYPDLVVESPSVSESNPDAGEEFTLSATIRNRGDAGAAATTLRYYRSADATISTADTSVATGPVTGLAASGSSDESVTLNAPSTVGGYYYGACVDGVVDESDTQNNCSPSVQVTVRGYPDLVVDSPSVSESVRGVGEEFTLSATVSNQGDAGAAATTLRYYRSADATISTADTSVATDPVTGLAASGSGDESVVLNAPSTFGSYYYGACVDGVVDESDTENNCSPSVQVTVRGYPDLVVESPSVSESSPVACAEFTLSATVRNQGDGDAAATSLRYYRSPDTTISRSDTREATTPVKRLAASDSTTESAGITAPSNHGTYYYGACVDSVDGESDTTNNCSSSVQIVVPMGAPDLIVDEITRATGGSTIFTGEWFVVGARVVNTGAGTSSAATVSFYRSTDPTITRTDTFSGRSQVDEICPSSSSIAAVDILAPSTAGTYYYGACVDSVPDESDTTNNCSPSMEVEVEAD